MLALQRTGAQSEKKRRAALVVAEGNQDGSPLPLVPSLSLTGPFSHFLHVVVLPVGLQDLSASVFVLRGQAVPPGVC